MDANWVPPREMASKVVSSVVMDHNSVARIEPFHVGSGAAEPEDVAMVLYTSGTSGRPKGGRFEARVPGDQRSTHDGSMGGEIWGGLV